VKRFLAVPKSVLICARTCLGRFASLAILLQASAIILGTGFRHATSMYGQTLQSVLALMGHASSSGHSLALHP
jgi:hypothetical protein